MRFERGRGGALEEAGLTQEERVLNKEIYSLLLKGQKKTKLESRRLEDDLALADLS